MATPWYRSGYCKKGIPTYTGDRQPKRNVNEAQKEDVFALIDEKYSSFHISNRQSKWPPTALNLKGGPSFYRDCDNCVPRANR